MGKARLGVLLAAAYGVGVVVLLVVGLALPCGTLPRVRTILARVPEAGQRAAMLVRVAAHAGTLGLKHLPLLEPQGVSVRKHSIRFCDREPAAGCGSAPNVNPLIHVLIENQGL